MSQLAPQRIVSLLASATEMLFGLGLGRRVVGVGHECDFPAVARQRPRLTISHIDDTADSLAIDRQVRQRLTEGLPLYGVDEQRLRELAPELIVTQAQCDVCAIKHQDVLDCVARSPNLCGARVVALNPMSLADVFHDIERLGEATGTAPCADAWTIELKQRVEHVRRQNLQIFPGRRPRVAIIEWLAPMMLAANWAPELLEWAGGQCLLTRGGQHSTTTGWEAVRQFDPEVIVVCPCGFDLPRAIEEARVLLDLPGWDKVSAVRSNRVHVLDGNAYLNRSGPRLVESLEILAHLFHPGRFAVPRVEEGEEAAFCELAGR